ncbi:MAG: leucyl aminopeptidase family protein [Bacteroidetes bacterium]|nr:leucyl aminopeptidase family protein [Bacteroidota bacterium]
MKKFIEITRRLPEKANSVFLVSTIENIDALKLTSEESKFVKGKYDAEKYTLIPINRYDHWLFIQTVKEEDDNSKLLEELRKAGDKLIKYINEYKIRKIFIKSSDEPENRILAFAEGMMLGNYQFMKYRKHEEDEKNSLEKIMVVSGNNSETTINELNIVIDAVYRCRDMVNEPVSYMNSLRLAEEIKNLGVECGAKVEVLNKKKIESLKMGGILAVNKGSIDPPTFTIMEWKPDHPVNDKPYVFVGKGVVFDTGGLNIKIGNYMETMKCDMAGAAAMATVLYAIASAKLPVHAVALIPATDNRLDGNAYAPGDIIFMHNGLTVEVINTDAEGRMILADALSYAQKYEPRLVFNAATLTGAASRAIGKYGIVTMQARAEEEMKKLKESGNMVYERIAEFPFWDEYGELIKSKIADIKNIGGADAGMITAGKFLEKFTDYPFIHLDIAGPAFLDKKDSYRTAGGTGMGVRLLFDYMKNISRE